ncbi:hypothetical protein AB0H88_27155 [Nonomuraea sp. NPDC050680]|uniref:hypothetical protein n=1 Tax=Nonomuraea sp. NPDC050680 TaxID=3154630 RepID=UPI0033F6E9B7
MRIAIPLFDRFTALDAVGPYEVLKFLPDATIVFVAAASGPISDVPKWLAIAADATFARPRLGSEAFRHRVLAESPHA